MDPAPTVLRRAVEALRRGGLVVFPTETFYGLGCHARDAAACARVATLKGRPSVRPFPVVAADRAQAESLWKAIPDDAAQLLEAFWPGPLTVVLPARAGLPAEIAASGEVGVRVSPHPIAAALARQAGPLVATSANKTGEPEVTDPARLDPEIAKGADALVAAGVCAGGRPSTVVALRPEGVVVLRQGPVTEEAIRAILSRRFAQADPRR